MQKTLYILRHAKAEAGHAHQDDHSRKLVDRGFEAAQIMGAYMFRQGIKPAKVICSDAVRTHQTWSQIEGIYPTPLNVEFSRKVYLASAGEMLNQLALLPATIPSVLIIGHNPGVHQLCLKLATGGDEPLIDMLHLKFPTCALAAIELGDIAWSHVHDARGTLSDLVTPKMLAGITDD